ncbi:MAG: WecB/TagA/CpsF family glycosyltransferase, partial [Actinomycetota bacterium]|nr:WecB/TagA/CpsF family glycosyltransferase [Actinomycetota bacterium]
PDHDPFGDQVATPLPLSAAQPDFDRPLVAVLGLPIDAVDMNQTQGLLEAARRNKKRCFLSTPNLNFAIQSQHDTVFRDSVCRSDLSTADGMPLVWIGRLVGAGLRERVSGASLFEHLREMKNPPWRVFFLGGPQGASQEACLTLGQEATGMQPVGLIFPGFGGMADMSRQDIIDCINDATPDFLLVSLGAAKGQTWITENMPRLNAPVISHLGAVVNFAAGTVQRAPGWVQRLGFEWAWRIKEEPALWRRYLKDGTALLKLALTQVLPLTLQCLWRRKLVRGAPATASWQPSGQVLELDGVCAGERLGAVRQAFTQAWARGGPLTLDLSGVTYFDVHFVGIWLLLESHMRETGRPLHLRGLQPAHRRWLHWHAAGHLANTHA